MKEYFSHDYDSRQDEKIINLIAELGYEGYGLFWALIEMMYQNNGYLKQSNYKRIAFALHSHSDSIKNLVENFELFSFDDDSFWSESVIKRLNIRDNKSNNAKKAANIRWKKHDADAMQTHSDSNAIKGKESKGKESKEIIKGLESILEIYSRLKVDETFIELIAIHHVLKKEDVLLWLDKFMNNLKISDDNMKFEKDFRTHFNNWLAKQDLKKINYNTDIDPKKYHSGFRDFKLDLINPITIIHLNGADRDTLVNTEYIEKMIKIGVSFKEKGAYNGN